MKGKVALSFPTLLHPTAGSDTLVGKQKVTPLALRIANLVVDSANNQGMPFVIIYKFHARTMIFDASSQLQ